jgi:hypothetical protein
MKIKCLVLILLIIFIVFIFVNSTTKRYQACIITWQNDRGYRFAVGPVQVLSVGCKTERESIDLVGGEDATISERDKIGKFNIYWLGRNLKSYEKDAAAYVQDKGWIIWDN